MKRDTKVYIQDILDSIAQIEEYMADVNTEDQFCENHLIQDAVFRRLEIIGEAVKNIPQKIKSQYAEISWKEIAGLRDILIHQYFGVNPKRTFKAVKEDLVVFKAQIIKIKEDIK